MQPLIMDASALLDEYGTYSPFFKFYHDGLKGLIKEAVITRSFNSPYTTSYHPGLRSARGLASKVLQDFEFAFDYQHDLFGEHTPQALFNLEFARQNLDAIRMVADAIEEEVDQFLYSHLRTRLFEIAQEGSDGMYQPRWSGRDLLIFIRLLHQRRG